MLLWAFKFLEEDFVGVRMLHAHDVQSQQFGLKHV